MTDIPELIAAAQAAREIGISTRSMSQYCSDGRVAARQLGGRWYITRTEYDRIVREGVPSRASHAATAEGSEAAPRRARATVIPIERGKRW